ncbi:MAG: Ig-like domain-containing protein, partial [Propionibacteriaceae bacterium]|nr:Ig-like domain-containing protein [Propionibacteriaceae bacterium]
SGVVRAVAEGATTIQVRASVSCPQETRPVTYDLWVDVSVADIPRPQGVLTVAPVTARTAGTGAPSVFTATATVYDSESSANGGRGDLMPGQQVNFTLAGGSAGQPALSAQTCTTGALGTCSVSLTSTLAGTFQLSATTGPKTLTGSPLVLTWNRGDPAEATSSLSVSPASVTAGGSATATVAVRDAFGNPATGLTLAGLGLSSAPAGLSFTNARETTPGVYTVTVTGTKAGSYAVEAEQPSAKLSGTLTVTPGAAAAVVLAVDPGVTAAGAQTVATAAVVDAHHNTVTGLDAGAFALDPGGLTIVSGPTAGAAGAYSWTLTSAAPGTHSVSVAARGFSDAQSVRYVVGAPGHIELAAANATSEASVASGAKATATVTVTDQAGAKNDDLTESDFTWTFTRVNQATGAAEATTEVHPAAFTRNPDGTYTWRLWATKAGTYQATVLAKGTADPDGLNQAAYTFTAGQPTTATLSLAVDSGPINAPVAATFVIRDNLGNGIGVTPAGLAAAYSSTPAGLAAEAWTQATDAYGNPTGVYRSNVEATAPGEYTARIGLPGAPAAADTIRLTQSVGIVALAVGPADHVVSDADGAGVTATVTVAGDGSPVAGLQAEDFGWGVTLQGKSSAAVKVKPGSFHETAPGTYEALLHSETAGTFQVTATAGGKTSSARALAFDPGPADAARSTWTIAPSTVALPENGSAGRATGTFVLADSFGNVISGQGANIALVPDGPGVLTPAGPAVQADQPGTYQWKLSTVTAGEYTVTAIHPTIGSKTATVRFTGFIPSPANSSFTIDPPSVATSDPAGAQATATLMVRDSDNQPIPGMAAGDISVTSTPAGLLLAPNTFQETAPGLYIFKVHSNQPAVYDVVAQAFGVPFADAADHATLTVTAAPSTARATVTKDGAQANGADQGIITVAVGDAWGNPVAGVTPTATAADLARFGDVEPTGADGTTTIAYTSVRPGGHAVEVTVPGVAQVTGSPVRLNFGAACLPGIDDGCAPIDGKALPHVEVTADGAVAEGTALNSVKAVIADQQGNPVAGLLVRASLDGGDVTTRQTGADGAAEFSFASFQSGPRQAVVEVYSTGQWRPVAVAVDPAPDETWLSSPVTLTFSHLPPDPVLSDVSVVGGATTINQRASFTVRATVHDGNDQSLAGVRVDFTADPPVELSADSCETGSTGSCSIQASSDDPATTRVAATVGGAAVRNSPVTLTWVYSPLVPAPQPTILEPASDRPIDDGAVTVRGTGQSGLTVTVSSDGAEVCRATVEADDTWACQAGSPLAHGEHVLEAVQTSPDPDTSPSSPASRVIIIDTVPPEPPVISAPAAGATTREATVNVTGTAEAGSSVTVVEGPDTILAAARANPNWGGPSPALADGEHTFRATATDEAGNTSEAATVTFTVKATPPAVAVASPFDGQTDLTARPEFSGQTDPGVLVTVAESGATLCEATADP